MLTGFRVKQARETSLSQHCTHCGSPPLPHTIQQQDDISFCSYLEGPMGVCRNQWGTRSLENCVLEELINYNSVIQSHSHLTSFSLMELNWFSTDRVLKKMQSCFSSVKKRCYLLLRLCSFCHEACQ